MSDSRHELALLDAAKKGAGEKAKVEADRKARVSADAKSKADHDAYDSAVKKGQAAVAAKSYDEAIASYTAASKLFRTDAALGGIKAATDSKARDQKAAADAAMARNQSVQRAARVKVLVGQGNAALGKKEYAKALGLFQEAKKLAPEDVPVAAGLSQAQHARDAEVVGMRRDADAKALVARQMVAGKAALGKKQFAEAATAFRAVLSADAANAEARKLLAQAEAGAPKPRDDDYKLAMSAGLAAAKKADWPGAANAYAEALRLRPGDAAATAARTDALARSSKPVPVPVDPKEAAYKTALTSAQVASSRKQWADAIKGYDAALAAKPGDPAAKAGRTAALTAQTNESYAAWILRGRTMMAGKKYADAIAAYDAALKLKPGDAAATKGKQDATSAATPKPKDPPPPPKVNPPIPKPKDPPPPPPKANPSAEYAKAMQAGAQDEAQKKWADAATAYATAIRAMPGDFTKDAALKTRQVSAYLGLARSQHALAHYAEAIKAYDEVLKRSPTDATAKAGLARAKANKP